MILPVPQKVLRVGRLMEEYHTIVEEFKLDTQKTVLGDQEFPPQSA